LANREEEPSVLIIDSQSVKTAKQSMEKGYDGGKKVKGRKRHLLVDRLGLIWGIDILPANIHDTEGGICAMSTLPYVLERPAKILADQGYQGDSFHIIAKLILDAEVEVVKKSENGFKVLSGRWVIERTFSWLDDFRRLARDYESSVSSATSFILLALSRIMLNRLS
jgi:putative transposase